MAGAAACLAAAVVLAGCGAGGGAGTAGVRSVTVTERDFGIVAPKVVSAGDLVLRVHNDGPDAHELIVVRLTGSRLPMRTDGLTVDEESLQRREAGSLEPGEAHATRELKVDLTPGRYVLFCNMAGHFMGGMHAVVVVR
jgi:uncharacterized cupredoxin-like copper-binding protein